MDWTRREVKALLEERSIRPRRRLGQNFLVDGNFRRALVRDAGVGPRDTVVEIGAGIGNLTHALAARARKVWAFEIDPVLHAVASELLAGCGNVKLVRADGATFEDHVTRGPVRFVSNLPYADWRRLLLAMLSTRLRMDSCTIMVQADVADRLRARPGSREYGPMAVLLQGACSVKVVRRAGRGLFHPTPRVDSTVLSIRRERKDLDFAGAERRLRRLFVGRRKRSKAVGGRRVEQVSPRELLELLGD